MSKWITIECEAEIDIDDYVDDISTDALVEELLSRKNKKGENQSIIATALEEFGGTLDLIEKVEHLNLIQWMRLRDFINNELTD